MRALGPSSHRGCGASRSARRGTREERRSGRAEDDDGAGDKLAVAQLKMTAA